MSFVTANGVRFNVQRLGAGERSIVCLHGLVMDNLSSWYYTVANSLAKQADVLLYDLRGHGLSDMPKAGYTVEDSVADLVGILDAVGLRRPVYLMGNSYGGQVGLAFARAFPARTAGLVLVEAHFAVEGWGDQMTAAFEFAGMRMSQAEVREWLEKKSQRNHARRFRRAESLMTDTSLLNDLRNCPPLTEDDLRAIRVPVLALYGERSVDNWASAVERGRDMERVVPQCELHILRSGTHSILLENTAWVRKWVVDWLARQTPPGMATEVAV